MLWSEYFSCTKWKQTLQEKTILRMSCSVLQGPNNVFDNAGVLWLAKYQCLCSVFCIFTLLSLPFLIIIALEKIDPKVWFNIKMQWQIEMRQSLRTRVGWGGNRREETWSSDLFCVADILMVCSILVYLSWFFSVLKRLTHIDIKKTSSNFICLTIICGANTCG